LTEDIQDIFGNSSNDELGSNESDDDMDFELDLTENMNDTDSSSFQDLSSRNKV